MKKIKVFLFLILAVATYPQELIFMEAPNNIKPFSIVESENINGLNSDIINKIIKPKDYKINENRVKTDYDISLLKESDNIEMGYNNSKDVFQTSSVILSKNNTKIKEVKEIFNKKIGVIAESKSDRVLANELQFYDKYTNSDIAFESLLSDKVEFLIVEKSIAKYYLKNRIINSALYINKDNIYKTGLCFKVKKENINLFNYLNKNIEILKKTEEYKEIYKENFVIKSDIITKIIMISILAVLIIVLIILQIKYKIIKKVSELKSIDMNGTIFLRTVKNVGEFNKKEEFAEKLKNIQISYPKFGVELENGGDSIKILISTDKKVYIHENMLDTFVNDLKEAFLILPEEIFIIQANIKGRVKSLVTENKFTIANNKNIIGLIKQ